MSTELFEFKYAPSKFKNMILNPDIKSKLEEALEKQPNMILVGSPGVGKGTFVNCLKNHTEAEFLKINCSDETGIDNIREKVKTFATSLGFGGIKWVYLNEADFLSLNAQAMLRDLMEQVQDITRFVLACNYGDKIIPELKSRCEVYEIGAPPAKEIFKRCELILKKEGVKFSNKTLIELVKNCYPDIRKTFVSLRMNIKDGILPDNISIATNATVYDSVLTAMKTSDPDEMRKVLRSNPIDYTGLYKYLYDKLMTEKDPVFSNDTQAILEIGEASYRDNVVAIKEINFMHMYFRMLTSGVL